MFVLGACIIFTDDQKLVPDTENMIPDLVYLSALLMFLEHALVRDDSAESINTLQAWTECVTYRELLTRQLNT